MRNIPRSLIDDEFFCVNYIVYLNDKGVRHFLYIAVRKVDMKEFKKTVKRGNFIAEDYGFVLEKGKGDAPDYLKEKMEIMYKCDHKNPLKVQDYNPEVA